jgi:uncharacterized protein (DUF305 family)
MMKKILTIIALICATNFAYADSTNDLIMINNHMHEGMSIEYTGNVDIDFLRQMIPHHESAVEMAKIVLRDSKDIELKNLAKNVIKEQTKEIVFMIEKLKKLEETLGYESVDSTKNTY